MLINNNLRGGGGGAGRWQLGYWPYVPGGHCGGGGGGGGGAVKNKIC